MLKFRTKNGELLCERISFNVPNYLDTDISEDFYERVFSLSDDELLTRLKNAIDTESQMEEPDEEYLEELELKVSMVKARSDFSTCNSDIRTDRAVRSFAIGLDMVTPTNVCKEFVALYDIAVKYCHTYSADSADWSEQRKADFVAIRKAMIDCFVSVMGTWVKSGFELKLTSKAVNGFLHSLYFIDNKTDKTKKRFSMWKTLDIYQGFKAYMMSINTVTGVTKAEKTVTIKVF